jgi:hypothetical protein
MQLRLRLRLRLRHLAAAATVAALALALVGCASKGGGSGSQGAGSGSSKKLSPLTLNPSQIAAASAVKTLMAGSAKVAMTVEVSGTKPTTITADGAFDFGRQRATLTFHFPQLGEVQAVFDKSVVYEKLGRLLGPGSRPWIKIDLSKLMGISAQNSTSNSTSSLAYLFGASGFTRVGSDSVRGVATTHYQGTLDLVKAAQKISKISPQFGAAYQDLLKSTLASTKSAKTDLWLDGQGRVRRMSYTMQIKVATTSTTSTIKSTVEYYSFGTPVSVQLPPADQVR